MGEGKKINSISQTDYSLIIVEFDTDVKTELARKQKVKDAIDRAQTDLPERPLNPMRQEFAFSEMPIMYVNVSGDYDGIKLKEFADKMQDNFEELPEITRAEIVGVPEREIQVNVDPHKMQVARISFTDIENAIVKGRIMISPAGWSKWAIWNAPWRSKDSSRLGRPWTRRDIIGRAVRRVQPFTWKI